MLSPIHFKWPSTFSAVNSSAANKLTNAAAQITAAKSRLQNAPALAVTSNPIAANCAGALNELNALHAVLMANVNSFCVHPWTQGVGQGDSHYRYLSPANAMAATAKKFIDSADVHKPAVAVDAICVLLSATSYAQLSATLQQFCIVFPDAQLHLCQRRAKQLATLEKDKLLLPDAAGNAVWRPGRVAAIARSGIGCRAVGERLSLAVGYEAGGVVSDAELINLANKKAQHLTDVKTAIETFAASFAGAVGRGVFIANKNPEQIKNQLAVHSLGHDEPLACCVVYAGAPGKLTLLREVLGL